MGALYIATNVVNTTFTDSGLLEVINYTYEIEANNNAGNFSPKSDPITISLPNTLEPTHITSDMILDGDKVYGDLYIDGVNVDLNGYKLTVNGDLIHGGGVLNINGGTLEVLGNYSIEMYYSRDGYQYYPYLKMMNDTDKVMVWGNFSTKSSGDHRGYLTNGILEIKGNFRQEEYYHYYNFFAGEYSAPTCQDNYFLGLS